MVELLNENGKVLARVLMPVREHNGRNFGDLEVDGLWDGDRTEQMQVGWNSLEPELMEKLKSSTQGRNWLNEQLKQLLSRPLVRYDDALKTKVESALKMVAE